MSIYLNSFSYAPLPLIYNWYFLCNSDQTVEKIQRPYLLLDVRDPEQFTKNHIIMAENYPKTLLSRANYETSSLLKYVK